MSNYLYKKTSAISDSFIQKTKPARILVVDDDLLVRKILKDLLEVDHYYVDLADSGAAGLKCLNSQEYDLILVDMKMRGISGLDFINKISKENPQLPLIAISGDDSAENILEAIHAGARDFLTKPIVPQTLFPAVKFVLSKAQDIKNEMLAKIMEMQTYEIIFKSAPAGLLIFDKQGTIIHCNEFFINLLGSTKEKLIGFNLPTQIQNKELRQAVIDVISGKTSTGLFEGKYTSVTGTKTAQIRMTIAAVKQDGEFLGGVGIIDDITKRIESERKYRDILTNIKDGFYEVDLAGHLTLCNPQFLEIIGYTEEEVMGKNFSMIMSNEVKEDVFNYFHKVFLDKEVIEYKSWPFRKKDGSSVIVETKPSLIYDIKGQITGFRGMFRDITERVFLLNHDSLTGLFNREHFVEEMQREIKLRRPFALIALDIIQFDIFNHLFGNAVSNKILQMFAQRLKENLKNGDTIARFGNDDIFILLPNIKKPEDVARTITRLLEKIGAGFNLEQEKLRDILLNISIGIALFPGDGQEIDALLLRANAAREEAKKAGLNKYRFSNPETYSNVVTRIELRGALRTALESKKGVYPHFQPLVDARTGLIIGEEALCRWDAPEKWRHISIEALIDVAYQENILNPLSLWIMEQACRKTVRWHKQGHELFLSVNIAPQQLKHSPKDLSKEIEATITRTGIDPRFLELEITETGAMDNKEQTLEFMLDLKKIGIKFALDDFGVGHASMSVLNDLPFDKVKVDKKFTWQIGLDRKTEKNIMYMIQMAQANNMKVVFEGVETIAQAKYLIENNCDILQGFLFSKAVAANDFQRILQKNNYVKIIKNSKKKIII